MSTVSDELARRWWPSDFRMAHRVTFGAILTMELVTTNTGKAPLRFQEALHSCFKVGDYRPVALSGLDGLAYIDKADGCRLVKQCGDIQIQVGTDRVYRPTIGVVELTDPVLRRRIRVAKENSRSAVVWNPWILKSEAIKDLGMDEHLNMVCIEAANTGGEAVELAPGEEHTMRATIEVSDL